MKKSPIRSIKAESVNRRKKCWMLTFSKEIAEKFAKGRTIYRLPNGVYGVRRKNCKPSRQEIFRSGQREASREKHEVALELARKTGKPLSYYE